MPRISTTAGFFLRLIVIYAALLALWPLVATSYARAYRVVGGTLFGTIGQGGVTRFQALTDRGVVA